MNHQANSNSPNTMETRFVGIEVVMMNMMAHVKSNAFVSRKIKE